jgi:hypothetical protein
MMMQRTATRILQLATAMAFLALPVLANAVVKYDEGRLQIMGIQLLQDFNDPDKYFYLPQYPRLSQRSNGEESELEFLCIKYIGTDINGAEVVSGGLFHTLIDFQLPPEIEEQLQEKLAEIQPKARIVGPVPLTSADEEELGMASFRVVSATLSNEKFGSEVVSSGRAPLTPGSKAAIAANLNSAGTTLLWNSFQKGNTSDVSIAVSGYYEATINAYNARVTASTESVYSHLSRVQGVQKRYQKRELRRIVDELHQDQLLNIEVLDQSKAFGLDSGQMDTVLALVTEKLTDAMFDRETGWAKEPEKETVEPTTKRVKRGFLGRLFKGSGNQKYITDDRYVLKKVEDIKINTFSLTLNRNSTIRVPYDSTGNLGGFFSLVGEEDSAEWDKYFRVVNLNDASFSTREVRFLLDGNFVEAFQDRINAVSFQFHRSYDNGETAFEKAGVFDYQSVAAGAVIQSIQYPRVGDTDDSWLSNYGKYRVVWNLRDVAKPIVFPGESGFVDAQGTAITLTPPFSKQEVRLFADTGLLQDAGIQRGVIKFATVLAGKRDWIASAEILTNQADPLQSVTIYHDRDEPIIYETTWYRKAEVLTQPRKQLVGDYVYLAPPIEAGESGQ